MSEIIRVKNRENKILEQFDMSFFRGGTSTEKNIKLAPLKRDYDAGLITIHCGCLEEEPLLSIAYYQSTGNYFLKKRSLHVHDEDCYFSRNGNTYSNVSSEYESGVKEVEGNFILNIHPLDFLKQETKDNCNASSSSKNGGYIRKSIHYLSIFSLLNTIGSHAWNRYIRYEAGKNYPTKTFVEIYNSIQSLLSKYCIGDLPLKEIFYAGEKEGKVFIIEKSVGFKYGAFTMLVLEDLPTELNGGYYIINAYNPNKGRSELRKLRVRKEILDKEMEARRGLEGPYFVGGFVTKPSSKEIPVFQSFALLPISDYGAPIQSSYERRLYNELGKQKRLVQRPTTSYDVNWNGFIPDGILIDTEPKTILEVFGMSENNIIYHQTKIAKKHHFSSLEKYNYWDWDAYKDDQIPALPLRMNK